eukprot:gene3522-3858_t
MNKLVVIHGEVFYEVEDPTSGQVLTIGLSKPYQALGNPNLLPQQATVFGAIILSDMSFVSLPKNVSLWSVSQKEMVRKVSARIDNYKVLKEELPFALTRWSGIVAPPCPHYPHGHRSERGLVWAHYRIWRDFLFVDEELVMRRNATKKEVIHSKDRLFLAYRNGTILKQGQEMREEDILVIFEDDAISSIAETNTTVIEELSQMKDIDILYLGWCEGRAARPVPLCAHAYAITRAGARKMVKYFEPCGRAVDEQLVIMAKNGWLRYRRAFPFSYKNMRPTYNPAGDRTQGIFRQYKTALGSIKEIKEREGG